MTAATVGRIVHYRPFAGPGDYSVPPCQAAIIVAVYDSGVDPTILPASARALLPGQLVTLCVFTRNGTELHDAEHDERTEGGGTWHWPERALPGHAPTTSTSSRWVTSSPTT